MEDMVDKFFARRSTGRGDRPLFGVTILMVEDSRYFSDAVRLMAIRSGARLRRADSLEAAHKHIKIYTPDVILVDIGLPDGSGVEFVREMRDHVPETPILAMSGNDENIEDVTSAGAKKFLKKPFFDLAQFQQVVLSVLPEDLAPIGFRPSIVGNAVTPDIESLQDDLTQIRQILAEIQSVPSSHRAGYCAQFLESVARVAGDKLLMDQARGFLDLVEKSGNWKPLCSEIIDQLDQKLSA